MIPVLIVLVSGCYDFSKFDNLTVDPISPKLVVPVVNSTISFRELAEREDVNTIIYTKPGDDKFYVAFRDTVALMDAASNYSFTDFSYTENFQLDASEVPGAPLPVGETYGPIEKYFEETYAPITGAEIASVKLTAGSFSCTLTNNFQNEISGELELVSLLDPTSVPVKFQFNNILPSQTYTANIPSLSNYSVNLNPGTTYNTLGVKVTITIHSLGNPITTLDNLNLTFNLSGLDFDYIFGKVNQTINIDDQTFNLDVFKSTYIADQFLAEPRLTMKFENSYGIPLSFNIVELQAQNTNSGQAVNLTNEGTPPTGSLLVGQPNSIDRLLQIVDLPVVTEMYADNNNSNLENLLAIAPNQYKLNSNVDIGDATPNHNYFIKKSSILRLMSEIEIPLVGWVETNAIRDTIEEELPNLEKDLKMINNDNLKIGLKFKFINNMPLNVYFQLLFLDASNNLITKLYDTVNEELLIKSAQVDPTTGKASAPVTHYSTVTVSKSKYDLMQSAKKMVFQIRLTTGGATHQNVVIETTNTINAMLSLELEGDVNLNE